MPRVGTFLGANTVADLVDFVAAQEFQLARIAAAEACPEWAAKDPAAYGLWKARLYDAEQAMHMALVNAHQVIELTPEMMRSTLPALRAWDEVAKAAKPFSGLLREMVAAGCVMPDFTGMPQPRPDSDVDARVYQWGGKALKLGEGLGTVALVVLAFLALRELKS